jgi:hypothetical protein
MSSQKSHYTTQVKKNNNPLFVKELKRLYDEHCKAYKKSEEKSSIFRSYVYFLLLNNYTASLISNITGLSVPRITHIRNQEEKRKGGEKS